MKLRFIFVLTLCLLTAGYSSAQSLPPDVPQSKGYMLGPGDELTGRVLGEKDYDFVATVNEDGKIEVPFSETPIVAKCKTERQIRSDINDVLSKYLKNPQLSVRVTDRKSRPPATIYGEVRSAQQVILLRKVTLVELLAFAGGVTEEAGGMIQVFRPQQPICTEKTEDSDWQTASTDPTEVPSRLYSLTSVRLGKDDANPIIYPGDIVVVKRASPVYVTGEVVAPQGLYIKESGLSLTEAIAMLGGVKREAKTKDIKIYRMKENSKEREVIAVNYDLIKKGSQKDVMLEPYDIVEVDKAKESVAQMILRFAVGTAKAGITAAANSTGYRVIY